MKLTLLSVLFLPSSSPLRPLPGRLLAWLCSSSSGTRVCTHSPPLQSQSLPVCTPAASVASNARFSRSSRCQKHLWSPSGYYKGPRAAHYVTRRYRRARSPPPGRLGDFPRRRSRWSRTCSAGLSRRLPVRLKSHPPARPASDRR